MSLGQAISRGSLLLGRGLRLRCPRCGESRLFTGWFAMLPRCGFCGLRFERAQGYFVGAIYVNYGVTVLVAMAGYFGLWNTTTISTAGQLMLWVPFVVLFPLWFFRYSRSLWLALEYLLNPEH